MEAPDPITASWPGICSRQRFGTRCAFYLAWSGPEREQTNFTLDDFRLTARRELLDGWQGWLEELSWRMAKGFDGTVPATGDWTGEHRRFYHRLEELLRQAGEAYSAERSPPSAPPG